MTRFSHMIVAASIVLLLAARFANAQPADVKAMLGAASSLSGQMFSQTGIYEGVAAFRGPQEVNVWGIASAFWPRTIPYVAPQPTLFSAGVDVMTWPNIIVGIAGSKSNLHATLEEGGHYKAEGDAGSLYARYSVGWGPGELTLGLQGQFAKFSYDAQINSVERVRVSRRETTQVTFQNFASPDATVGTVEGSASWLVSERWFQHGPLANITYANSNFHAFAESGSEFSRLFGATGVSNVHGGVGYQARFTYLKFQPYAEVRATYLIWESVNPINQQLVSGGLVTSFPGLIATERWSYSSQVGLRIFVTPAVTALFAWTASYMQKGPFISNTANAGLSVGF